MAENKSGWQFEDHSATYNGGDGAFSGSLDIRYPSKGLHSLQFQGAALTGISPLRISPEPPTPSDGETVIESYSRGRDLVVTYAQTAARTTRPQVYWTYLNHPEAVGIQATVSVQTSLLDSDPTIRTHSRLGAGELFQPSMDGKQWHSRTAGDFADADSPSLFLFRPEHATWSYAEALFPADFQGATVSEQGGNLEITFALFPEFLEKGVIRRGRIQSLFMARKNDKQVAMAAHQRLATSPAPLTT